jgi:hypothetical protein
MLNGTACTDPHMIGRGLKDTSIRISRYYEYSEEVQPVSLAQGPETLYDSNKSGSILF